MDIRRKKIINILFMFFIMCLLAILVGMNYCPEEMSKIIGFRSYVVLTDSMEPKIPTYSIVFSKMLEEDKTIDPNSIVTFRANRFGEDVLLTHYFKETQEKDGQTFYRTQGATAPEFDNYETSRNDIVGEYLFHIPYIGKFILLFQSPFGFVLLAEWAVILLINKTIKSLWEEKNKSNLQRA